SAKTMGSTRWSPAPASSSEAIFAAGLSFVVRLAAAFTATDCAELSDTGADDRLAVVAPWPRTPVPVDGEANPEPAEVGPGRMPVRTVVGVGVKVVVGAGLRAGGGVSAAAAPSVCA